MEDSVELPQNMGQKSKEAEKYKKVKVLGEGSMGRAYLVESSDDQKLYVMKRINIGHLGPKQKQNALRQAQLHSLFCHPNIVELKEVYQTTGQKICIVMEYAQGGDLEQFLQQQEGKHMSQQTILNLFSQLCLGLQEVHAKRIIHRDLKTANIFLTKDKIIKIGDFGISKSFDKTSLAATSMIGTPYYLSPEMVEGKPYSTKADIWALGVMLYQLCALKLPFQANSLPVLALKIMKGSFPPLPSHFSKDIKTLLLQMLSVDQKKRPSIQAILLKPIIYKLLSKQDQVKQAQKQDQKKQVIIEREKKEIDKKVQAFDKDKQMKIKAKRDKQEKREEMRKQMREDLRKRRADKQKDPDVPNTTTSTLVVPQTKIEPRKSPAKVSQKAIKTPKPQVSAKEIPSAKQIKKQQPVKPWKNRKPGEKKDVTIQMYVPELKPKPEQRVEKLPPGSDFKVELYVSKKPKDYQPQTQEIKKQPRKSLPQLQQVENYHYSDKKIEDQMQNISEGESEQQQIEEQYENSDTEFDEILNNVRNLELMTRNLPDPSKSVCLYEQSDNFDSTVQARVQPTPHDIENLQHLLNSQSLQELRQILEDTLGDQNFISSYGAVKKHLDQYYQLMVQKGEEADRQTLKQKYVFNKQHLRKKLYFLSDTDFDKNIELLFTLIMYEDLQMQKNHNKDFGRESKYSRLF